MASQAALEIVLSLRDTASKPLSGVAANITDMGKRAEHTHGLLSGLLQGAGFAAFNAGISAVAGGFRVLSGFIGDGIADAREANTIFAQSEAVIKSTGGAAGVSAQQVADFATSLSAASGKSLFGDAQIAESENLLLTFTSIKGKILEEATAMSVDMAQALGGAPSDAAVQLGKALQDPVRGISALSRVGVTFNDQQKAMIANFVKNNDLASAQGVILAELGREFGGSAAAAAAADGGIAQFQDTTGELGESIGAKALPMVQKFFGILNSPGVTAGIKAVADSLINGIGKALDWLIGTGIPALVAGWQAIQKPLGVARDAVLTFVQALKGDWVNDSGILPFHAIIGEVGLALREFGGWIATIGQQIAGGDWSGAFATLTGGLTSFGATLGATLLGWGQQFVDWIAPMIPPALAALGAFVTSIGTWIVEQLPVIGAQLLAWGTAFVDWVAPMIPPALAALGTLITSVGAWVVEQVPILITQLMAWGTAFVEWVQPMIPPALAALGALATGLWAWISEQAAPILAKLSAWATSFIAWIPGATADFLSKWPAMLEQFLDWIGTAAGPLLTKLGEWAVTFIKWIVPMIPGFVVALGGIAVALLAFIAETAVTLLSKVYEWGTAFGVWIHDKAIPALVEAWPGFLESLSGLIETAKGWLSDKASALGTALIAGVKAGIAAGAKLITDAIVGALTDALAAAKRAIGISSPSRVFADEVGTPIVQGIAQGFTSGMPRLLNTITTGVGATVGAAVNSIQSGSGGVAKAIQKLLATGNFAGGIFGKDEDDPFIEFLLTASTDATALTNILDLLATGDFKGGILGLSEDDPFILALLKAASAATDLAPTLPVIAGGIDAISDAATDAAAAVRGFVKASSGVRGGVGTLGGPDSGDAATSTGGGDPNETFAPRPGAAAEGTAAGTGAGMGFGDGWKTGLESIAPVIQDTTRMTFQQLHEVVLLPWQEDTRTFFGGAGFGFIGAASVGIMSAAGGMADVAGAAGGMAGSTLVSTLSSAAAGVGGVVSSINAALGSIERNITITITTQYVEVGTPP